MDGSDIRVSLKEFAGAPPNQKIYGCIRVCFFKDSNEGRRQDDVTNQPDIADEDMAWCPSRSMHDLILYEVAPL